MLRFHNTEGPPVFPDTNICMFIEQKSDQSVKQSDQVKCCDKWSSLKSGNTEESNMMTKLKTNVYDILFKIFH